MLTRILTALALVAIFLPLFIIGGPLTYIMVAVVSLIGMYELTSLTHHRFPKWTRYFIMILCMGICFVDYTFIPWALFLYMFVLFVISICYSDFSLEDVILYTTLGLLIGLAGHSTLMLGLKDGMYLIYIASITYGVDTGAYFVGRFFGKHKLNERISPKKTIEGSIGGFVSGLIISLIFSYFVPSITNGFVGAVFYGVVLSLTGQVGDLIFSLIKRHYHIKDYGSFLPGHGGMLDRIDSLLLNFCFFMICSLVMGVI